MNQLHLLQINNCSFVVVDQVSRGPRVSAWDSILRACSRLSSLRSVTIFEDTSTSIDAAVLSSLQLDADSKSHALVEEKLPREYLESLLPASERLGNLEELSLSCAWNETNQKRLVSFVERHGKLETLDLSLRLESRPPSFTGFLKALTTNTSLKQVTWHAPASAGSIWCKVDVQSWKSVRQNNTTLEKLEITPVLPTLTEACNHAWLEMNRSGYICPHRFDHASSHFWTHILSYPRVSENRSLMFDVLSRAHPILIRPSLS